MVMKIVNDDNMEVNCKLDNVNVYQTKVEVTFCYF